MAESNCTPIAALSAVNLTVNIAVTVNTAVTGNIAMNITVRTKMNLRRTDWPVVF
jgi:hypothetical protein